MSKAETENCIRKFGKYPFNYNFKILSSNYLTLYQLFTKRTFILILSDVTIPMLLIYLLQIFLVPYQAMNYVARKADKTRLRFLVLTSAYFVFNITWFSFLQTMQFSTWKEIPAIGYMGVLMIGYTCYYILKECGINKSNHNTIFLVLTLGGLYLIQHLAKIYLPLTFAFYVTIISTLSLQVLVLVYAIRVTRPIVKSKINNGSISPIYVAAFIAIFVYCFSPLFFSLVSNASIEFVIINLPFATISLAYIIHDVKQNKSESNILPQKLTNDTLSGRYERLDDETWLIAEYSKLQRDERNEKITDLLSKYDLTERQSEIALMILSGESTEEIANKLNLSDKTVRWHIMGLSEKVGVSGVREFRKKFFDVYSSKK